MNIKPIETVYRGHRFRSRLEARWAVFFDALGIAYQYEPQGFEIERPGESTPWRYLPDFFLPATETWVEVKGDWRSVAVDYGGYLPSISHSVGTERGLLLLGPLPQTTPQKPLFPILQHRKGIEIGGSSFECPWVGDSGFLWCRRTDDQVYCAGSATLVPAIREWVTKSWSSREPIDAGTRDAFDKARMARFEHGSRS